MPIFKIASYEDLITQEPGFLLEYTKFNAWLKESTKLSVDNQQTVLNVLNAMSIDNAFGNILDKLGELVGIKRTQIILNSGELIDDTNYRKVIKGKIAQNYWNGTLEGFQEILNTVFSSDFEFFIVDNQDMSIDVFLSGLFTATDQELLTKGYYTPKPMGVDVNYFLLEAVSFGFDLDTDTIQGWDKGYWTTT